MAIEFKNILLGTLAFNPITLPFVAPFLANNPAVPVPRLAPNKTALDRRLITPEEERTIDLVKGTALVGLAVGAGVLLTLALRKK